MAEAFLNNRPPVTVTRELRLSFWHRPDFIPSNARFDAGLMVGAPVENEVFIPEDRVDWAAIREHLTTVRATVFGRYETVVHNWRTDRRRVGVRIVFENDVEAVFGKMLFS